MSWRELSKMQVLSNLIFLKNYGHLSEILLFLPQTTTKFGWVAWLLVFTLKILGKSPSFDCVPLLPPKLLAKKSWAWWKTTPPPPLLQYLYPFRVTSWSFYGQRIRCTHQIFDICSRSSDVSLWIRISWSTDTVEWIQHSFYCSIKNQILCP